MSQKDIVIKELKTNGFISRNFCLRNYISRLSAIILTLKKEGWELEGKNENGDYIYEVKGSPFKKVIYTVPELGKTIEQWVK